MLLLSSRETLGATGHLVRRRPDVWPHLTCVPFSMWLQNRWQELTQQAMWTVSCWALILLLLLNNTSNNHLLHCVTVFTSQPANNNWRQSELQEIHTTIITLLSVLSFFEPQPCFQKTTIREYDLRFHGNLLNVCTLIYHKSYWQPPLTTHPTVGLERCFNAALAALLLVVNHIWQADLIFPTWFFREVQSADSICREMWQCQMLWLLSLYYLVAFQCSAESSLNVKW